MPILNTVKTLHPIFYSIIIDFKPVVDFVVAVVACVVLADVAVVGVAVVRGLVDVVVVGGGIGGDVVVDNFSCCVGHEHFRSGLHSHDLKPWRSLCDKLRKWFY